MISTLVLLTLSAILVIIAVIFVKTLYRSIFTDLTLGDQYNLRFRNECRTKPKTKTVFLESTDDCLITVLIEAKDTVKEIDNRLKAAKNYLFSQNIAFNHIYFMVFHQIQDPKIKKRLADFKRNYPHIEFVTYASATPTANFLNAAYSGKGEFTIVDTDLPTVFPLLPQRRGFFLVLRQPKCENSISFSSISAASKTATTMVLSRLHHTTYSVGYELQSLCANYDLKPTLIEDTTIPLPNKLELIFASAINKLTDKLYSSEQWQYRKTKPDLPS